MIIKFRRKLLWAGGLPLEQWVTMCFHGWVDFCAGITYIQRMMMMEYSPGYTAGEK